MNFDDALRVASGLANRHGCSSTAALNLLHELGYDVTRTELALSTGVDAWALVKLVSAYVQQPRPHCAAPHPRAPGNP